MKSAEEKLIALKVMLSVQDVSELAAKSKSFKVSGVFVLKESIESKHNKVEIVTPFIKEVSWMLYQLQYVFKNNEEDFLFLCQSLELKANLSLKETIDYLLKRSGMLLK